MTEDTLSLNIVRAPFVKRKTAKSIEPPKPVENTDTGQKIKKKRSKEVDGSIKRPSVWKAIKGKLPKNNNVEDTFFNAQSSKTGIKPKNFPQSQWKTTKLFANNPDVPSVPYRAVQPILEPVFSKKAFKDLDLHPFMVKTLEETLALEHLTAVQEKLIPVFLKGSDALVRSQTGSGKTLAFAVPIVQMLQSIQPKLNRTDGVRALIIAPSRELALQIHEIFTKLSKSFTWLVPGILMGGEKRKSEKARLRKGITILTATPGRLLDHLQHTDCLNLKQVQFLVLDEADRMLDLGYEQDVKSILESFPVDSSRQTVLLSATLTSGVERLAGLSLRDPVRVDIVETSAASVPVDIEDVQQDVLVLPGGLSHSYIVTPAKLRLVTLAAFIVDKCLLEGGKLIVFMATQDMVDLHAALLSSALEVFTEGQELQLSKLHGNMAQTERTKVFFQFRQATCAVLLCTDVAARGLDLPEVDWVIQYNGPASISDYVHRVGRTARRGLPGATVLFLATTEVAFVSRLEAARVRLTQFRMEDVLSKLCAVSTAYSSMQEAATRLQALMEGVVTEEHKIHDLACKAYTSWVRFYASYPRDLKECFSVKSAHLGHFAKSFALQEPPTVASKRARDIAANAPTSNKDQKRRAKDRTKLKPLKAVRKPGQRPQTKRPPISEFDSGLEPIKKRKLK